MPGRCCADRAAGTDQDAGALPHDGELHPGRSEVLAEEMRDDVFAADVRAQLDIIEAGLLEAAGRLRP